MPWREGDEENDPLIGLYGGAGEGLRTTTRDQGETNRSEGRSLLAGDSARSHRRQAGSDPSRESQLESERESVAPVLRILAGQELGVGAAAERDGGTRRQGVIGRAADQRQAPGQADETKSPCRQVRSRRIRSGRPASTMNGIAKQRKTGTSGGVEAEVLAPEGRADRSHRPLRRVLWAACPIVDRPAAVLAAERLRGLGWKRFELRVTSSLAATGVQAAFTGPGADGGVAVGLTRAGESRPFGYVQGKAWGRERIGGSLRRDRSPST